MKNTVPDAGASRARGRGGGDGCGACAARLDRIEAMLKVLIERGASQEFYSTAEAARRLGRSDFTVREWCRLSRVKAEKRACGRGPSQEWKISHAELERVRSEGLLPRENPDRAGGDRRSARPSRNRTPR